MLVAAKFLAVNKTPDRPRPELRHLAGALPSRRRVLAAIAAGAAGCGLLAGTRAFAENAPTDEDEWLQRVQNYFNLIRTMQSRFVQVSSNGEVAEGTVYIERPGRMRVEYDPPVPVLIVSDGDFLVYFDKQLEQVTHVPLGQTPASILLAPSIKLRGGELTVTEFARAPGAVRVTVVRNENPGEGSLTLVFTEPPLELKQWVVRDAQGLVTTVTLQDARFEIPLKRELFVFKDPRFLRDNR